MSEPKFTPGPWHVKDNGLIFVLPPDDSGNLVVAGCGQTYSVSDWEKERSLANATLISLAPEMLNELEVVQSAMLSIAEYSEDEEIKESARQHAAHINIIVKKARGEE